MPLTDTWLKKNLDRERSAIHTEPDQDGLSVRVSQKGKVTFLMCFRYNDTHRRRALQTVVEREKCFYNIK